MPYFPRANRFVFQQTSFIGVGLRTVPTLPQAQMLLFSDNTLYHQDHTPSTRTTTADRSEQSRRRATRKWTGEYGWSNVCATSQRVDFSRRLIDLDLPLIAILRAGASQRHFLSHSDGAGEWKGVHRPRISLFALCSETSLCDDVKVRSALGQIPMREGGCASTYTTKFQRLNAQGRRSMYAWQASPVIGQSQSSPVLQSGLDSCAGRTFITFKDRRGRLSRECIASKSLKFADAWNFAAKV